MNYKEKEINQYFLDTDLLFSISVADVQSEANEKLGRFLTDDELFVVKKSLEDGIMSSLAPIYKTIFLELIN